MRRLYLVRHGETDANLNQIVQGQLIDPPLNETGRKQARLTALAMAHMDFKHIYFSPSLRARQTAQDIFECHEPPFWHAEKHPGLMEINQGVFEGMTTEEVQKRYQNLYWTYKNRPAQMFFPDGESMIEAYMRVNRTVQAILEKTPDDDNILIVSHGGAISLAFIGLFAWNLSTMYHGTHYENCSISAVEWPKNSSRLRILVLNDTCHLKKISEK